MTSRANSFKSCPSDDIDLQISSSPRSPRTDGLGNPPPDVAEASFSCLSSSAYASGSTIGGGHHQQQLRFQLFRRPGSSGGAGKVVLGLGIRERRKLGNLLFFAFCGICLLLSVDKICGVCLLLFDIILVAVPSPTPPLLPVDGRCRSILVSCNRRLTLRPTQCRKFCSCSRAILAGDSVQCILKVHGMSVGRGGAGGCEAGGGATGDIHKCSFEAFWWMCDPVKWRAAPGGHSSARLYMQCPIYTWLQV